MSELIHADLRSTVVLFEDGKTVALAKAIIEDTQISYPKNRVFTWQAWQSKI